LIAKNGIVIAFSTSAHNEKNITANARQIPRNTVLIREAEIDIVTGSIDLRRIS
jgi:hypothetical protein